MLAVVVLVPAAGRLRGGQLESLPADTDLALRRLRNARSAQAAREAQLALWNALADQDSR